MQQQEIDRKVRQLHRLAMIGASLFATLMLLKIATTSHELLLLLSLTDCQFG
jgi:hypothetical protein